MLSLAQDPHSQDRPALRASWDRALTNPPTGRRMDGWTGGQMDGQVDRQTDMDRQVDRQTDTHILSSSLREVVVKPLKEWGRAQTDR